MSVRRDFLPSRESDLVTWSSNFKAKVTAAPQAYGISEAQSAEYAARHDAFAAAYQVAQSPETRSPTNIVRKNTAMKALVDWARTLSRLVQAMPGVSDQQKSELGLTVRAQTTPQIPAPAAPPRMRVVAAVGRTVTLQLYDASSTRRGRPRHVAGAAVFSYVGPTAPPTLADWTYEGNRSETRFDLRFPAHLPIGTTVWFAAYWFNPRLERGPVCDPISTDLPSGSVLPPLFALAA